MKVAKRLSLGVFMNFVKYAFAQEAVITIISKAAMHYKIVFFKSLFEASCLPREKICNRTKDFKWGSIKVVQSVVWLPSVLRKTCSATHDYPNAILDPKVNATLYLSRTQTLALKWCHVTCRSEIINILKSKTHVKDQCMKFITYILLLFRMKDDDHLQSPCLPNPVSVSLFLTRDKPEGNGIKFMFLTPFLTPTLLQQVSK